MQQSEGVRPQSCPATAAALVPARCCRFMHVPHLGVLASQGGGHNSMQAEASSASVGSNRVRRTGTMAHKVTFDK